MWKVTGQLLSWVNAFMRCLGEVWTKADDDRAHRSSIPAQWITTRVFETRIVDQKCILAASHRFYAGQAFFSTFEGVTLVEAPTGNVQPPFRNKLQPLDESKTPHHFKRSRQEDFKPRQALGNIKCSIESQSRSFEDITKSWSIKS